MSSISSVSQIFQTIRQSICTLEMPHGTVLRETELAQEFGVSRTPVRQALHQLAAFGLVETRNGVGTIVTAGDPGRLNDIYQLRIQLAGLIGQSSTSPCPTQAADNMRSLQERSILLENKISNVEFWKLNEDRHRIVNAIIENLELRSLHDLYYYKVAPFWFQLFKHNPDQEISYLVREIQETAFWMENGNMLTVANMQQNHIAMAAKRLQNL